MNFNPNYKTKDDYFEAELDKKTLTNEKPPQDKYYRPNKELTICKITVFNTVTNRMSEKSIYYNEKKGFYFKGNSSYWNKTPHSKYYIDDLVKMEG